jgi:hypothetical protein
VNQAYLVESFLTEEEARVNRMQLKIEFRVKWIKVLDEVADVTAHEDGRLSRNHFRNPINQNLRDHFQHQLDLLLEQLEADLGIAPKKENRILRTV